MDMKPSCVNLSVQPTRVLMDEKFIVLVQNVPPFFKLTVHALCQCRFEHNWEAFGHYTADATGTVNVSEDLCLGGTYSGVEPMGLLWSLRPIPGSTPASILFIEKCAQTPLEVKISVYQGHQSEGFLDQVPLASVMVERWYRAPGVRRIPISEDGLIAAIHLPPGPGPFPGIFDLVGYGPKLTEFRPALLASRGFASLTVDYMTPLKEGKEVDNEYFEKAYRIFQQHPQVFGDRVAIVSSSFGNSITFKLVATSQIIKPRCMVCIGGTHVQPASASLTGVINFIFSNSDKVKLNEDKNWIVRDIYLPIPTDTSLKVDMGKIQFPLLIIAGEDDQCIPAYDSAMDMKETMERAGNSHLLTVLTYPKAGHNIEIPYTPHAAASVFRPDKQTHRRMILWGGKVAEHSRAQEDAWRKTLIFLRKNLCVDTGVTVQ